MTDAQQTQTTQGSQQAHTRPTYDNSEGLDSGWRTFAGVMLVIAAVWNIIDGLIAILDSNYYASVAESRGVYLPITDELAAWGWVALLIGLAMLTVAFGVFANKTWAQVVGVIIVGLNVIYHFAFLAAFPYWSLAIIAFDALIIYGLVAPSRQTVGTSSRG